MKSTAFLTCTPNRTFCSWSKGRGWPDRTVPIVISELLTERIVQRTYFSFMADDACARHGCDDLGGWEDGKCGG